MKTAIKADWLTTKSHQWRAAEIRSYFVMSEREGVRYEISDKTPWPHPVRDLIRELHDGEVPNEWRYELTVAILNDLIWQYENSSEPVDGYQTAVDLSDTATSSLAHWLHERPGRATYVDDYKTDWAGPDASLNFLLNGGQFLAIWSMVKKLRAVIEQ